MGPSALVTVDCSVNLLYFIMTMAKSASILKYSSVSDFSLIPGCADRQSDYLKKS